MNIILHIYERVIKVSILEINLFSLRKGMEGRRSRTPQGAGRERGGRALANPGTPDHRLRWMRPTIKNN